MDEDKFKREVLSRLDKIATLLSIHCAVSNGSLDKAKAESALRQVIASGNAGENGDSAHYLLRDEMQDDYEIAMQRWKSEKGS